MTGGGTAWDVYRAVVERQPDAVLLYSHGRLVDANPAARERLRSAGVLGDGADPSVLADGVGWAGRAALTAAVSAATRGQAVPAIRLVFHDRVLGAVVCSCSVHPVVLDGDDDVQVVARDVTESDPQSCRRWTAVRWHMSTRS